MKCPQPPEILCLALGLTALGFGVRLIAGLYGVPP